jgi:hypothetical protein
MAQAVSLRPVTAEPRFQSQANPVWICGGQGDTGTGFSPVTVVSPPFLPFHTH